MIWGTEGHALPPLEHPSAPWHGFFTSFTSPLWGKFVILSAVSWLEINQSGDGISMADMDDHQLKIALDTGRSNASDVAVQISGALLRWWHDCERRIAFFICRSLDQKALNNRAFDTRAGQALYLHARLTSLDRILPTVCVSVRVFLQQDWRVFT